MPRGSEQTTQRREDMSALSIEEDSPFVTRFKQFIQSYFWIKSGTTSFPSETRHWATGVQFGLIYVFCSIIMSYPWLLDYENNFVHRYNRYYSPPSSHYFMKFFIALCMLGLCYFSMAFLLSMISNVPRLIKSKNSMLTFFYTLIFTESVVLSALLWIVWFVLYYMDTQICTDYSLCQGLISGIFVYCNLILVLIVLAIVKLKRSLGIGFKDVFLGKSA